MVYNTCCICFFLATSDLCFIVYYLKESLPQKYRSSNLISGVSGIIMYINPIDLFQFNGVSGLSLQACNKDGCFWELD